MITVFTILLLSMCEGAIPNLKCNNGINSTNETTPPFCVMEDYDKRSLGPMENKPFNISVVVKIDDIQEINDHKNTVELGMVLSLSWIDSRLHLVENSSSWVIEDDYLWTTLDLELLDWIWTPDLDILHINDFRIKQIFETQEWAVLYGSKRIWYEVPVEITLNCPLFDFDYYPFDTQICDLKIGSYSQCDCECRGAVFYNKTNERKLKKGVNKRGKNTALAKNY